MNRRVSFPVFRRLLSVLSPCRGYHPGVTMTEDELRAAFQTPDGKPRVSGRPYLPGSLGAGMPESLDGPREDLPYAIDMSKAAEGGLTESLVANTKSLIKEHIPRYGALLFKGLPIRTKEDYSFFNKALGLRFMPYKGGLGVRNEVADTVMTASREPPPFTIELHNEMSYAPVWPKYLSFCCDVPPAPGCGGESVLLRNSDLKRDLDLEVVEKFKRLQVRYTQFLPSKTEGCYHSWQEAFHTSNKGGAEDWMKEMGYLFEWGPDNSVFYWYNIAATQRHHTTGEEVWFNHAHMNKTFFDAHPFWGALRDISADKLPQHTKYGDGSDIEPEVMQHIRNCTWKNTIGVQLEKGELLFLDNMAVQHGRLGFVGDRKMLLTLSDDHL